VYGGSQFFFTGAGAGGFTCCVVGSGDGDGAAAAAAVVDVVGASVPSLRDPDPVFGAVPSEDDADADGAGVDVDGDGAAEGRRVGGGGVLLKIALGACDAAGARRCA
jgi:hypothetical protein